MIAWESIAEFYKGKRVLVTGHTGFKGSWLSVWLHEMGAEVTGLALDPSSDRDLYVLTGIGDKIKADLRVDIRNLAAVKDAFKAYNPEIVFHLAAQPLVRLSYEYPVDTYATNVMGTVNVMEAIRDTSSVKIAVMITTDKCYENNDEGRPFIEEDPFGGYDPYSSSKGACEIAIRSWRRSFFNPKDYGTRHNVSIASVRAGNVIGGGDWSKDRIIPDCIRAIENGKPVLIRSPHSVRPWEHVLEPLSGYLLLAMKMWENPTAYCEGWNFGPEMGDTSTVWEIAGKLVEAFGKGKLIDASNPNDLHEASLLSLSIRKAKERLGWCPTLDIDGCISLVAEWYKSYGNGNVYDLTAGQISRFISYNR